MWEAFRSLGQFLPDVWKGQEQYNRYCTRRGALPMANSTVNCPWCRVPQDKWCSGGKAGSTGGFGWCSSHTYSVIIPCGCFRCKKPSYTLQWPCIFSFMTLCLRWFLPWGADCFYESTLCVLCTRYNVLTCVLISQCIVLSTVSP